MVLRQDVEQNCFKPTSTKIIGSRQKSGEIKAVDRISETNIAVGHPFITLKRIKHKICVKRTLPFQNMSPLRFSWKSNSSRNVAWKFPGPKFELLQLGIDLAFKFCDS